MLATLEFLVASGLKPTVTSLRCGHSYLTSSGNVSEHTTGTAVDIAAVNGVPILGHQGAGSIAELAIQRLLTLQGTLQPHQIISLMTFEDAANTFAMADHADHIHVGFRPLYGVNAKAARQVDAILKPEQWIKLIDRLDEIDNPTVPRNPSKYAVAADKRASSAHKGEEHARVLRVRPVGAARAARTGSGPLRRAALRRRPGPAGRRHRRDGGQAAAAALAPARPRREAGRCDPRDRHRRRPA